MKHIYCRAGGRVETWWTRGDKVDAWRPGGRVEARWTRGDKIIARCIPFEETSLDKLYALHSKLRLSDIFGG
jgi:hypothetical protein